MNRELMKLVGSAVVGLAIGATVGTLVTRHILSQRYELRTQEEIESVRRQYQLLRKEGIEPRDLLTGRAERERERLAGKEKAEEIISKMGYTGEEETPPAEDEGLSYTEVVPTEDELDEDAQLLKEMKEKRGYEHPYIITIDEYMEPYEDHEKESLRYFDEDDVLTDDREEVLPEVDYLVGVDNLTKFGLFSKDKNTLYVRNERSEVDFEIILDKRSYMEVVAGFREPKPPRNLKMREDG